MPFPCVTASDGQNEAYLQSAQALYIRLLRNSQPRRLAAGLSMVEDGMKPEEYQTVLDRLEKLERRDRRMRLERLAMLVAIVWLVATGPASRLVVPAAPRLQAGERGMRSVAARSLAGLRHLLRVQPVLDRTTVIEDEREAFDQPAAAPSPAKPATAPAVASNLPLASPESKASAETKSLIPATTSVASRPEVSQAVRPKTDSGRSSRQEHALLSKRAIAPKSTAASASLAAAGLLIGRDVQKRLTGLPGDGSLRTLALAEWPDAAMVASQPGAAVPAAADAPLAVLPEAVSAVETPPASAPPAEAPAPPSAVLPTPVALKALGYAQAADGSAQIVLSNGNALFVVNEGQEFLDRFRVVSLRPEGVDVEDRLINQTLHLTFGY